ncbi:hypothetical protein C900_01661 [Fulvivirga imtechensis AK7]|uniref:Uncharacterized protein n=1 Tax=Fulvivirga imtechensis AK7 TaxID=1237149 RepID=L8JXM3_9BACT|nr:hypothetical protein C900_01661 [Fulvivirga imtechensis AK7]
MNSKSKKILFAILLTLLLLIFLFDRRESFFEGLKDGVELKEDR